MVKKISLNGDIVTEDSGISFKLWFKEDLTEEEQVLFLDFLASIQGIEEYRGFEVDICLIKGDDVLD